ncbi:MAG: diguanylate cyclase [Spirochaetales bacterium]|nr:diguanylate cyclase [Spirochaetales bacterium]
MQLTVPKKIKIGFFLLFLLLQTLGAESFHASSGYLDLSKKATSGVHQIGGEWLFSTNQRVYSPLTVPAGWQDKTGYVYGKGYYSLTLQTPEDEDMAIYLPELQQRIRVTTGDRVLYNTGGGDFDVGLFRKPLILLDRGSTVILDFELQNDFSRKGGFCYPLLYGSFNDLLQYKNRQIILSVVIITFLFFIFFYNLFLFLLKYADVSFLYLSLGALCFALRGLMEGEHIIKLLIPTFSLGLSNRLGYFFLYLGISILTHVLIKVLGLKKIIFVSLLKGLFIFTLFMALYSLFLPFRALGKSVYFLQALSILILILTLAVILRAVLRGEDDVWILLIGAVILFAYSIAEICQISGYGTVTSGVQKGMFYVFFSLFIVTTKRYGKAYLQAKELSRNLEKEVARQTEALRELSFTDELTGINNRRRFFELGNHEVCVHNRYKRPLAVIMLDIDHFKRINDQYGHSCGDKALIYLAGLCRGEIRDSDILARLGGEEFALLLFDTEAVEAREVAERIRLRLEGSTLERDDLIPPMTVSIGVVQLGDDETLEEALERADSLMYKAKNGGRNRVEF